MLKRVPVAARTICAQTSICLNPKLMTSTVHTNTKNPESPFCCVCWHGMLEYDFCFRVSTLYKLLQVRETV